MNTAPHSDTHLLDAFRWWEKRRLLFNVLVGGIGLLVTILFCRFFGLFEAFGVVMWGGLANILYSLGFLLEVADRYYLQGTLQLSAARMVLFLIGTTAYVVVTAIFGAEYYAFPFNFE